MRLRLRNLPWQEGVIPAACLFLAGSGVALTYLESRARGGADGGRAIGSVTSLQGEGQRRPGDGSIFYRLGKDQAVFSGDVVRTSRGTVTTIRLTDGTRVELGELSMAVVHLSATDAAVEMKYGSLRSTAAGNGRVRLVMGDRTLVSTGGVASVARDRVSGAEEMIVERGSAVLVDRQNQQRQVSQGQRLLLEGGSVREQKMPVLPIEPAPSAVISTEAEATAVTFRWSGEQPIRLLVRGGQSGATVHSETHPSSPAELRLPPGEYSWNIVPADGPTAPGPPRTFQVRRLRPLELISPSPSAVLETSTGEADVVLRWQSLTYARAYRWEVSSSADFSQALRSAETNGSQAFLRLAPGSYYWRVTVSTADGSTVPASPTRTFQVQKLEGLKAPALRSPRSGAVESLAAASQGIVFSWTAAHAGRTALEISEDSGFSRVVSRAETSGNMASVKLRPTPGTYFWRVRTKLPDGRWTPHSREGVLLLNEGLSRIALKQPAPSHSLGRGRPIRFAWDGGQGSKFRLLVSRSEDFRTGVSSFPANLRSITVPGLPAGRYYWKVTSATGAGQDSSVRSFQVLEQAPAPSLIEPRGRVDMSARNALRFRWSEVREARAYLLSLSRGGRVLLTREVAGTEFNLTDLGLLDVGEFAVEVVALYRDGSRSETARGTLRIALSGGPNAPTFADSGTRFIRDEKRQGKVEAKPQEKREEKPEEKKQ